MYLWLKAVNIIWGENLQIFCTCSAAQQLLHLRLWSHRWILCYFAVQGIQFYVFRL